MCRLSLVVLISALLLAPFPAQSETNILLIVDGSNSMWGQIDGRSKIETARETLGTLISDMPSDANLGLMAYGHRREKDCDDLELLSEIGKTPSDKIVEFIHAIQPKGKTPIANTLASSKDAFKGLEGQNNHIVLVSDGIESCDGDPCAVAAELQKAGLNVRAHVIGFGVSEEEGQQLTCIAANTDGKYFSAADTAAFNDAIKEVTQIAQAAPEPQKVVWFEDNFDGEDLSDEWEVINPNPDNYIVEEGVLTVLAAGDKPLVGSDQLDNIFLLTKGLPSGDWTATIRFIPEVATFRELYTLALYKDKDNMLSVTTGNRVLCCDNHIGLMLWGEKVSKGQKTGFEAEALSSPGIGYFAAATHNYTNWTAANEQAIFMRIEKTGRKYTVSAKVEGDLTTADGKEPQWVTLQKLTSLRSPGDSLVMALTQTPFQGNIDYQVSGGEALVMIDWIKIETMAEPD